MQTGWRLRRLFVTILIFCEPTKPEDLWAEFRQYLCDDLGRRVAALRGLLNPAEEQIYDYGLFLLEQILRNEGRSLSDWPSMPRPAHNWASEHENPLLAEQLYDLDEQYRLLQDRLPQLNIRQRQAYDSIIPSILENTGKLFFINGPGGTGKTFLYNVLCNKVRSEGLIVLCVASSGIAALLLPGGRTSHFTFKIPIDNLCDTSTCSINKRSPPR
ncbi:PIF1-like helicase-domain-containing protein [Coprinopsis sp. MPI-PUGE-AT-0042]|nr:PIF1-like helicase-domain-containing protein [Coprinopsis sp. MPI-PUGE-AT-0042]